jgi:asparagine synthase (glutamine-hydrolysing)
MCGICGKSIFDAAADRVAPELLRQMMATLSHRGPDDSGMYVSPGIGLGHTRLKIIDLTTGFQPMSNEDGSVHVVFNGEIYNYKELRGFLFGKGHRFTSTSDTEVIVHLYEELGVDSLQMLRGMFAIALWDEKKRSLLLARDRVGIKPLYYLDTGRSLLFASEIKAILADPEASPEIDLAGVDRFLTYHYMPGDLTLLKGVKKLPPGHFMTVAGGEIAIHQYWDLHFAESTRERNAKEYSEELLDLLAETVGMHMIADVPVGVLLSGGVDSSAMLSFAAERASFPISTFTLGFEGQNFADERPYAKLVAEQHGCRHYEATITAQDFRDCLPRFVWHMEEPVCEPPGIALFYITKLAREHVKVLISGEGGDEAFAGYQNYRNCFWMERIKHAFGSAAGPAAGLASRVSRIPGLKRIERYATMMGVPFESYYYSRTADPFHSLNALKPALYSDDFRSELSALSETVENPIDLLLAATRERDVLTKMLYVDSKTWLPDDLLVKADKMTMANSVELRVPLLDHRILEFAASLPRRYKLRGWTTKYLLKKALARRVPREILKRRKTGFPVPYESWMRHEMRDYVAGILSDSSAAARGFFSPKIINRMLERNRKDGEFSTELFSLLILELWQQAFLDCKRAPACQLV